MFGQLKCAARPDFGEQSIPCGSIRVIVKAAADWGGMHAGIESMCFTVSRAFQLLSCHPYWLEQLRDEQQAILQQHGTSINTTVSLPSGAACMLMGLAAITLSSSRAPSEHSSLLKCRL